MEPLDGELHVDGTLVERLLHLESLVEDLRFVESALDRLQEVLPETDPGRQRVEEIDVVQVALWNAATIAYSRCFVAGLRHAAAQDLVPPERVAVHKELGQIRAEHLAHFGRESDLEQMTMIARFALAPDGSLAMKFDTEGVKSLFPTAPYLPRYLEHVAAVRAVAEARHAGTIGAIEAAMGAMDSDVLLGKLKRGDTVRLDM